MNQKDLQLISIILREIAGQIDTLRLEDIEGILTRTKRIELKISSARNISEETKANRRPEAELLNDSKALHQMKTREEGKSFLHEKYATRAELVLLAKTIDVPVYKNDTIETIIEKIVEATIGYRIRSAAVQGET